MERQNRLLTIVSIIFLALMAVVMLGKDDKKHTPAEDGSPARHALFDFKAEDISKLELTRPGDSLVFEKKDGVWSMTAPKPLTIDPARVNEIVDRFVTLEVEERDISGKDEDFGLDPAARVVLTFTGAAGKTYSVTLGKDTSVGYATYLREKDGGPVELAASKVGDLLHRTADDFRAKQIWSISPATARRIKIDAGTESVILRKDPHGWWLGDTGPRADQETVDGWLSDAGAVRVDKFLDGSTPAAAGVEPPAARISVEDDNGTQEVALGPTADDGVNAVVPNGVVHLGPEAAKLVKLTEWSSKKLVTVRRYQVDRMEVTLGSKSIALTRKDGEWQDKDGKASAVGDALMDKLNDAPADWATPGVAAPTEAWGTIVVAEGDTRKETIHIGQALPDGSRVARDEAGGPPFRVLQADLDAIASVLP